MNIGQKYHICLILEDSRLEALGSLEAWIEALHDGLIDIASDIERGQLTIVNCYALQADTTEGEEAST